MDAWSTALGKIEVDKLVNVVNIILVVRSVMYHVEWTCFRWIFPMESKRKQGQ